jgi:mitochondrial fission protein ELM1
MTTPPRTWLLLGGKPGDDQQALIVADALGWPYEVKTLRPRPQWVLGKPRFRPTLDHLDLERSDALAPPWPELVITIGRRPAAAGLWLRQQAGPATRLVLIGRPKRWSERFALIVAPEQFRLPDLANVVRLELPLIRIDEARIRAAVEVWRDRLAPLPRPLTAVLVGGATKPYRFDRAVAQDLLAELGRLLARDGGTLWVTTSRRTQGEVVDALARGLPKGHGFYPWNADTGADNPYLALLGLADRFVVTGDSVSMMVEVARLGRPLAIFPLPLAPSLATRLGRTAVRMLDPRRRGPLAVLGTALVRTGLIGYGRDLEAIHRRLVQRGLAVRLGQPFREPAEPTRLELDLVVQRIRALFGLGSPSDCGGPATAHD